MFIFDTKERKKVQMDFNRDSIVRMFVCGPTVQDAIHLGHARTYIFFDVLARYLRSKGLDVFYLQNITDIDDKIIRKGSEEGISYREVADRNIKIYMDSLKKLDIQSINFFAKSTQFIDRIIKQVSTLLVNGSAYITEDGVYFRVSSFKEYGSLSGQPQESLLEGARVETNDLKESQKDFVIWKGKKEGEPYWPSPFGEGRPGWHIEDTAITETFFGYTYDIHGGGLDLIFPHHEAEIAIEQSISHEEFLSRFWIHTGMLNLNSEKMSKSTGNFVTVESILEKWSRFDLRLAFLNAHYRSSLNLSEDMLAEARSNCTKFSNMWRRLKSEKFQGRGSGVLDGDWKKRMRDRFEDDMDTRGVISLINELIYSLNTSYSSISSAEATEALSILEWVNGILGILDVSEKSGVNGNLIQAVIDIRNAMRGKRDFETSDLIRKKLLESGIYLEDRDKETIWWEK